MDSEIKILGESNEMDEDGQKIQNSSYPVDLVHRILTIANNTILHTWKTLIE